MAEYYTSGWLNLSQAEDQIMNSIAREYPDQPTRHNEFKFREEVIETFGWKRLTADEFGLKDTIMDTFTVVLLYPEHLTDDYGAHVYISSAIEAPSVADAVLKAQQQCHDENSPSPLMESVEPTDFRMILVLYGEPEVFGDANGISPRGEGSWTGAEDDRICENRRRLAEGQNDGRRTG